MYLHSRLTIHAKILIGYSALLLLLATVGGIGWYGSQLVGHQSEELYHEHLQGTVTLATAESTLWELRWGLVQYMVVGEAEQAQIVRDQEGLYRQLDKALADYGTTDLGPEERAAFAKLQQAVAQYVASRPRFFQLMAAGQQEEAAAWRAQTTTRYGKQAVAALQSLIAIEHDEARAAEQAAVTLGSTVQLSLIAAMVAALGLGLAIGLWSARSITRSIRAITSAALAIKNGDRSVTAPVLSGDETGMLAQVFNEMLAELNRNGQQLENVVAERTIALQEAVATLETRAAEQERLLAENMRQQKLIQDLSAPVIPALPGVLVMPLVGLLEGEQISAILANALAGVEQNRAKHLLLDVTGVAVVDTAVARALIDIHMAVGLLGAEAGLVGVRPEVAQTIVSLGLDLRGLRAYADLQSAMLALLAKPAKVRA